MGIITRQEALNIDQKWYFTGIPCNHGHVANRSTKNRVCFECQKTRSQKFRDNNTDYHHKYNKQYYPNNKERAAELSEKYYDKMREESPEILMERQRKNSITYIRNNKNVVTERDKLWRKENSGYINSLTSKRRAKKLNATPLWINYPEIQEIYLECEDINTINKMCGGVGRFVVDHIIPLQGKNVSGLHIANNLQIITERENAIKSNKFNEEEI